ncbi:uncharacterized protein LOC123564317 [Mercenaria mercenaria]|uniref:uncharacterized protein LOC123564317 n=1 Tax=Mercenaria mercenaria TaxID=6596 RepID=UPI00234F5759|nr:uncharacterized protein LOC123564317 [Mercenaria mercenaria]XP_053392930.1 uncharacterized protein LOC123564317 [Mercenaria mercenaria]
MASAGPISDDPAYNSYDPGWTSNSPPFDARYPHQNQMTNCIRNFMDYHRCKQIKGEDYVNCNYFKKVYIRKCNPTTLEKMEEQMENGIFQYRL